uniref:Uncharacterized protein n=1 Tax=Globodera rostochiensis TaxID=31243 RepID=A0A914H6X5_GLORO
MTSALQRQCARSLFIVVAALLLCCCRSEEDDWDLRNFTCAKTGDKLRGGFTIPRDNQIHIDPSQIGYYQQIRVLVVNAKDENLTMTVVGAEPSCRRSFSNRTKCRLSEEKNAILEHQSKECTAHAGCKEFSFSCKQENSRWSTRHDRIFIVNMNFLFQFLCEQCDKSRVYIDDARLLNNRRDPPGERCPESTDTTTTQSTTTMKNAITTTSSSTTTSTGSTVTTESTDTGTGWWMKLVIIILSKFFIHWLRRPNRGRIFHRPQYNFFPPEEDN